MMLLLRVTSAHVNICIASQCMGLPCKLLVNNVYTGVTFDVLFIGASLSEPQGVMMSTTYLCAYLRTCVRACVSARPV